MLEAERNTTTEQYSSLHPKMGDTYAYTSSREAVDAQFVHMARQVHAASYLGEGFIHDEAVEDGQVAADIDKARGESVTYYVGFDCQADALPISTLRKVAAEGVGGVASLPGYELCKDTLYDKGKQLLHDAEQEGRSVREISAFGHIPEVPATAGYELLRHIYQEAHGSDELWFFVMVTKKYRALLNSFGPQAVQKVGDEVTFSDERIGDVSLTPCVVDIETFLDDIQASIVAETVPARRRRMTASLQVFAEGLDPTTLSSEVREALISERSFNVRAYASSRLVPRGKAEWEQPQSFDVANSVDAARLRQLIDKGEVTRVHDYRHIPQAFDADKAPLGGRWFYYPWNQSLVHFPDEQTYYDAIHDRDRNIIRPEEQAKRIGKTALIAGLSVGSHIFEHMQYAGVVDGFILADYDTVSVSNLNRLHAGMPQVGERKVDYFAKRASELNPYIQQTLLREGVTEASLEGLERAPSILFDAVDDFAAKALLRQYAQHHGIPVVMATDVGYKSIIDIERHDLRPTLPFNGRLPAETVDAMLKGELTEGERMQITTRLIGLGNASIRLLDSVNDPTRTSFPQLEVTAAQGGALATIAARDILLDRRVPSGRYVHDARKALRLSSDVTFQETLGTLSVFAKQRRT